MFRIKPVVYSSCSIFFTAKIYDQYSSKTKYTYEEINKHNTLEKGIWTTYKNNVYDITNYIDIHPGGKDKILLAAGTSVEPYWQKYIQHVNPFILETIMTPMKIGEISDYNPCKYNNIKDIYIDEPIRSNELYFHKIKPCNAEVNPETLIEKWITPNNQWYIRNHSAVPKIDIKQYKLTLITPYIKELSIKKLKQYPKQTITTTIQCGGNRRGELNTLKTTSGTPWNIGAISTAKWSGIWARDMLPKHIDKSIKHIHFIGIDDVTISIPIEKVLNPYGDVMLAYEMNGEEIPRDHGYPIRLIVPGYVGIRNIKWLKSIKLSEIEAEGSWQKDISYKALPNYIENLKDCDIDIHRYAPINEPPIQSSICKVTDTDNKLKIEGFAWSGGGRGILRVDVSLDGGDTWQLAELKQGSEQNPNRAWAWTFWELNIDKPNKLSFLGFNKIKIICKATDIGYNTQPKHIEDTWNIRGLNNNSWHSYTL